MSLTTSWQRHTITCQFTLCPMPPRRSAMMRRILCLAVLFALSPLHGLAGEMQVTDVKELAGSWRGWVVTDQQGDERATMNVSADGTYKASTITGSTTEG